MNAAAFVPIGSLLPGMADPACRAIVTIPARNEEKALARCLDAFAKQTTLDGRPVDPSGFEVLLLLNNTTDRSAEVARGWQQRHPSVRLHVLERTWPTEVAHVGTARRWLMDTAWARLGRNAQAPLAILSTDADSVVAPDWLVQNLRALEDGADVVGGELSLIDGDMMALPAAVQRRYRQDRRYAALVARLEDALDPQSGDRCPRHLDHFGASLACTPRIYAAVGGMPTLPSLEDEAFIDAVRCADGRLRHDPRVKISTSARLNGRAAVGMAAQLRMWRGLPNDQAHLVASASFLQHRFLYMGELRRSFASRSMSHLDMPTADWRDWVAACLQTQGTFPAFLHAINSDALIRETFHGRPEQSIKDAIAEMERYLASEAAGADVSLAAPLSPAEQTGAVAEEAVLFGSRQ